MIPNFPPEDPVQLGLGLLEIGKPWGHRPAAVPPAAEAVRFLESAYELGIRYFDCAASYGDAEHRFGLFLRNLTETARSGIVIATKFGEHWDPATQTPFVSHSYAALERSLDRSLELLGRVDVLQLHKTTPAALRSDDVARAWDLAAKLGVAVTGPSVSDAESAQLAAEDSRYRMMQLPLNRDSEHFADAASRAQAAGMYVAANRPFAMGRLLSEDDTRTPHDRRVQAFRFVLDHVRRGVVLTGTRSAAHLAENLAAFEEARLKSRDCMVCRDKMSC